MEIWWQYASAEGLSPFISGPWGRSDLLVSLKWGGGGVGTCERIHRKLVFSTILPYYRFFQNLSSFVLNSSGAALQDVINQKKTQIFIFTLSNCTRVPKSPRRTFYVIATATQISRSHARCIFGYLFFIQDSSWGHSGELFPSQVIPKTE